MKLGNPTRCNLRFVRYNVHCRSTRFGALRKIGGDSTYIETQIDDNGLFEVNRIWLTLFLALSMLEKFFRRFRSHTIVTTGQEEMDDAFRRKIAGGKMSPPDLERARRLAEKMFTDQQIPEHAEGKIIDLKPEDWRFKD